MQIVGRVARCRERSESQSTRASSRRGFLADEEVKVGEVYQFTQLGDKKFETESSESQYRRGIPLCEKVKVSETASDQLLENHASEGQGQ